ncbi:DUF3077 domain-containing protein [Pseudomonas sp. MBT-4]|uniref:DUF3077 domain-containing protein n=1 Tax=Pseudomonas rustica TaxID=2827099 RepID=A0ABS5MWS0_9PSED|nr:DUF3077 domain-containing protein [Pseudomonas rustica]
MPVITALSHVSHLLHISRLLTADSSVGRNADHHAYASQYLQELSKALIDDVVKVMDALPDKPLM